MPSLPFFSFQVKDYRYILKIFRPANVQADVDNLIHTMDEILAKTYQRKIHLLLDMSEMEILFINIQWKLLYASQTAIAARIEVIREKVARIAIHRKPDMISSIVIGCINSLQSTHESHKLPVAIFKNRDDCTKFLKVEDVKQVMNDSNDIDVDSELQAIIASNIDNICRQELLHIHSNPVVPTPVIHERCKDVRSIPVMPERCDDVRSIPVVHERCDDVRSIPIMPERCDDVRSIPVMPERCDDVRSIPVMPERCDDVRSIPVMPERCGDVRSIPVVPERCDDVRTSEHDRNHVVVPTSAPEAIYVTLPSFDQFGQIRQDLNNVVLKLDAMLKGSKCIRTGTI